MSNPYLSRSHPVRFAFLRALGGTAPIPAALQERMAGFFTANKDWDGLSLLCARPELTGELDARFATIKAVDVRAAWLRRPCRTEPELAAALHRERRVKVLSVYAQMPTAPEAWYRSVLAAKSTKLAAPLVGNESLPLALRQEATACVIANAPNSFGFDELGALFDDCPELHDVAVEAIEGRKARLLPATAQWGLSAKNLAKVADHLLVPIVTSATLAAERRKLNNNHFDRSQWHLIDTLQRSVTAALFLGLNPKLPKKSRTQLADVLRGEVVASLATTSGFDARQFPSLHAAALTALDTGDIFNLDIAALRSLRLSPESSLALLERLDETFGEKIGRAHV